MICPRCKGKGEVRDTRTRDEDPLTLYALAVVRPLWKRRTCPICAGRGVIRDA